MNIEHYTPPFENTPRTPESLDRPKPNPKNRKEQQMLTLLQHDNGEAFKIYLEEIWEDTPIEKMNDDFYNRYWGDYTDFEQLAADLIEAFDWGAIIEELSTRYGVPEGALTWNEEVIYDYIKDNWIVFERDGRSYIFHTPDYYPLIPADDLGKEQEEKP